MSTALPSLAELENASEFQARHLGPWDEEQAHMLSVIGVASRQALLDGVVPASIKRAHVMDLPAAVSEAQALAELKALAKQNRVMRNFIGQGYYGTHIPGVVLRHIRAVAQPLHVAALGCGETLCLCQTPAGLPGDDQQAANAFARHILCDSV